MKGNMLHEQSAFYLENIEDEAVPPPAMIPQIITREVVTPFRVLNEAIDEAMGKDHQAADQEGELTTSA